MTETVPRCSLCGSEYTTKVSCPLNPDAKYNPWRIGNLTGDRGNPLKHPRALDIMRDRARLSSTSAHSDLGIGVSEDVTPFIMKQMTFYRNPDDEIFLDTMDLGTSSRKVYSKPDSNLTPFKLNVRNIEDVKETVEELSPEPVFGEETLIGHYNLDGDLVYISLHGLSVDEERARRAAYSSEENINLRREGLLAKYKDRLYTFREIDYGWYPIGAEEARHTFQELANNLSKKEKIPNLNKYLIVHTIEANSEEELPRKIDIRKNLEKLAPVKYPFIGPETIQQVKDIFKKRFFLPMKYRSFSRSPVFKQISKAPNKGREASKTKSNMKEGAYKILATAMLLSSDKITFDLSPIRMNYDAICNKFLPQTGPISDRFLFWTLWELLGELFFINRWNRILSDGTGVEVDARQKKRWHWRSIIGFNLREKDGYEFLKDICALLTDLLNSLKIPTESIDLEKKPYQTMKGGMINTRDFEPFFEDFKDILRKYKFIDDGRSALGYRESKKMKATTRSKGQQVMAELSSYPPVLFEGSILYPGGRQYVKAIEEFPGIDKPWIDWCYTVLDREHKDELLAYAKALNLQLSPNPSKAEICLALIAHKEGLLFEESEKPSSYG